MEGRKRLIVKLKILVAVNHCSVNSVTEHWIKPTCCGEACNNLCHCAKRSLRPCAQSKLECTSVRPFVRKVITFCEEDMRGDHVPLDLGVLNDRFLGFEKFLKSFEKFWNFLKFFEKSAQSVHINADCS